MTPPPFIDLVVGARPNYIKAAALLHAERDAQTTGPLPFRFRLVATGQHQNAAMTADLAAQLGMPQPDVYLNASGDSPTALTTAILQTYGQVLQEQRPLAVAVVGDVTSTLACAIAARQRALPVIHVEAGLRSGDWTLPEELNRVTVDHLSELLFATTDQAATNLRDEGLPAGRIHIVGNTVIDTLLRHLPHARRPVFWEQSGLQDRSYWLLTLHRPSNVDAAGPLLRLLHAIAAASAGVPVVFPIHPRTQQKLGGQALPAGILPVPPQAYLEFLYLLHRSRGVLTDSGGVSEEATVLQKPCVVLRPNTERPETIEPGRSTLALSETDALTQFLQTASWEVGRKGVVLPYWDGQAAARIIEQLARWVTARST